MTSQYTAFCLLSYETNRFKLLCFCTVIDHRRCQDVMRTSVVHLAVSRVRQYHRYKQLNWKSTLGEEGGYTCVFYVFVFITN